MTTTPRQKYTPQKRDVNAAKRAILAIELRMQKLPYSQIAQQAGYASPSAARTAIQRELEREVIDTVEEYRRQELTMLDAMHSEIWPLFLDKSNKARLFAADRLMTISERRSRLLGLDQTPDQAMLSNTIVIREAPRELVEAISTVIPESVES